MQLVYKFNHKHNKQRLTKLCKISNNLYNQALFLIKKEYDLSGKYLSYKELDKLLKTTYNLEGEINYRLLKAQVAQQILKNLDKNYKSFFKSIKEYNKNPSKFKGLPKPPSFKKKEGLNVLYYTNQCSQIKNNKIILEKDLVIPIPKYKNKNFNNFNQIRIIPKNDTFEVEIIYTVDDIEMKQNDNIASIDFGINNLVTLLPNKHKPLIINGKQIKHINQFYNKQKAYLTSIKDKMKLKYTKLLHALDRKRNNKIKDLMHKTSAFIVQYCLENNISKLIVGYNKSWKTHINLGKRNNQQFTNIPFHKLLQMLYYKCKMIGCNVIETEESYTSKCDHLSNEEMKHHKNYLGKRIKRGLFKSNTGKVINSDVNGALGIMRKVVDESVIKQIINRGLLFNPVKIKNLFCLNEFFLTNEFKSVKVL